MEVNQLRLQGVVCTTPIRKVSPSGISHYQFLIEHRCQRKEAGLARQVWCRMPVVVSGTSITEMERITVGMQLIVNGFICSHKSRNGLHKLVLHTEQIELIDSGDKPNGTLFPPS